MTQATPSLDGRPLLLDAAALGRTLTRLAHQIAERHPDDDLVLAGVRTRGVPLAERLARALEGGGHGSPRLAALDVRHHRDDRPRSRTLSAPALEAIGGAQLPKINGSVVVVVDDVLYTGRTLRAALDALIDAGRPSAVELAVLIDRGHRELPLRATYVGKNVPTAASERVTVRLHEVDGMDGAWMTSEGDG